MQDRDIGSEKGPTTRQRGRWAESLAVRYLQQHGYRILDTNFTCRGGELDVVAYQGTDLCFVEVRFRKETDRGRPVETVGKTKQARLIRAAKAFVQQHPRVDAFRQPMRFDVVSIVGTDPPQCDLIRNAFETEAAW
jgi:putative endonuclease